MKDDYGMITHTLIVFNTYNSLTTTLVTRTRLNVTFIRTPVLLNTSCACACSTTRKIWEKLPTQVKFEPLSVRQFIILGFYSRKWGIVMYGFSKRLVCIQVYVVGHTTLDLLPLSVLSAVAVCWGMRYKIITAYLTNVSFWVVLFFFHRYLLFGHNSLKRTAQFITCTKWFGTAKFVFLPT
jgi:hypothetical protein